MCKKLLIEHGSYWSKVDSDIIIFFTPKLIPKEDFCTPITMVIMGLTDRIHARITKCEVFSNLLGDQETFYKSMLSISSILSCQSRDSAFLIGPGQDYCFSRDFNRDFL